MISRHIQLFLLLSTLGVYVRKWSNGLRDWVVAGSVAIHVIETLLLCMSAV